MPRSSLWISETVFVLGICAIAVWLFMPHKPGAGAVSVDLKMPDNRAEVDLTRSKNGQFLYTVHNSDGSLQTVTPDQLAQALYQYQSEKDKWTIWQTVLHYLSNPIILFWLGIGLVGQILFTGRMVVQWIASERQGKSVVPALFWWMSLVGSVLLLAYFLWRRDPIGLLGQAFGSFVYLKNIMWILAEHKGQPVPLETAESQP